MPNIQYDDANSYFAMLIFLGTALVPTTWIFVQGILKNGFWAQIPVPNQPLQLGSNSGTTDKIRSPVLRRHFNNSQVGRGEYQWCNVTRLGRGCLFAFVHRATAV